MSQLSISSSCHEVTYEGSITGPGDDIHLGSDVSGSGLIQGDEIVAVDDTPLQDLSLAEWRSKWAEHSASDNPLLLTLRRQGMTLLLPVSSNQRDEIESKFPSLQAFRCELEDGRLQNISIERNGESSIYYRFEESTLWSQIAKSSEERFVLGVFNEAVGVQARVIPPEPVAPPPIVPPREEEPRASLLVSWLVGGFGIFANTNNDSYREEVLRVQNEDDANEPRTGRGNLYTFLLGIGAHFRTSDTSRFQFSVSTAVLQNIFRPNIAVRLSERGSVGSGPAGSDVEFGVFSKYICTSELPDADPSDDPSFNMLSVGFELVGSRNHPRAHTLFDHTLFELGYAHSLGYDYPLNGFLVSLGGEI